MLQPLSVNLRMLKLNKSSLSLTRVTSHTTHHQTHQSSPASSSPPCPSCPSNSRIFTSASSPYCIAMSICSSTSPMLSSSVISSGTKLTRLYSSSRPATAAFSRRKRGPVLAERLLFVVCYLLLLRGVARGRMKGYGGVVCCRVWRQQGGRREKKDRHMQQHRGSWGQRDVWPSTHRHLHTAASYAMADCAQAMTRPAGMLLHTAFMPPNEVSWYPRKMCCWRACMLPKATVCQRTAQQSSPHALLRAGRTYQSAAVGG